MKNSWIFLKNSIWVRTEKCDLPYHDCTQPTTEVASVAMQYKILGQYLAQGAFSENSGDHGFFLFIF